MSAEIVDWRSCTSEPTSLSGDAMMKALIADGMTVWMSAVATGA